MNTRIARRSMLVGTGIAALGATVAPTTTAVAATTPTPSARSHDGDPLLGGWLITRRDDGAGGSDVVSVVTFAAGGAFATTDVNPPSPLGLGTWTHESGQAFEALFWEGQADPTGVVSVVNVRVHGHRDGETIHGRYVVHGTAGGHQFTGTGSFHGHRIEV